MDIKKDILNAGILIIEDDYLNRVVLKEIFKKQGFTRIEEATNGIDGLEKIRSFYPDIVILDVIMPEMDGVECCERIRNDPDPRIAKVPILFQTSLDGTINKARLFKAGATDYVTKPIDPHEITARVVVHLERAAMTRHLQEYQARTASELNTARVTQQVLIPNKKIIQEIEKDYRLQICDHYQPCSEVGGDFWGFRSLSSEKLAVYMVDFSGHGVNAALNVFRLHMLMQSNMDTAHIPGAYLAHLNAVLAPLLPTGQFATMFYGIINVKDNTITYSSAAAPPPVLFNKHNSGCQMLEAGGIMLGALKKTTYDTTEVEFNCGDCLLLYSDALIETPDAQGNMLPIENWIGSLQSYLKVDGADCRESFASFLSNFEDSCSPYLTDDLTLNAYFL